MDFSFIVSIIKNKKEIDGALCQDFVRTLNWNQFF
jgi:hypothetical protein